MNDLNKAAAIFYAIILCAMVLFKNRRSIVADIGIYAFAHTIKRL